MDAYNGSFRIATTVGWASQSGEATSWNNVYVLDGTLNTVGSIENIAPGEQIYSTRFMGDRAYMVTYRTTDPLFVMDLSTPTAPKILGELKIPGYSNYLHPIDETHIIGFGKDAVELESQWDPGTKWAYYQGMKVALFDITDVANPVLQQSVAIGDRGTDSELLWNHKALLYQASRSLMAFPVNLNIVPQGTSNPLAYGEFSWQGMMVYQVSAAAGFKEIGRISHIESDINDGSRYVSRAVSIGNVLYTLSQSEVQAHSLTDMQKVGGLAIGH
jgi:inhibitor of cysteine peptidase